VKSFKSITARSDRRPRDFSSKEGSIPAIFCDYFFTKAGESSIDRDAVISLALVDSRTGFLGCVPMNGKAQFDLATKGDRPCWEPNAFTAAEAWGYDQFQPCTLDLVHAACSVDSEQVPPTPRADSFRSGIWQSLPWPGL